MKKGPVKALVERQQQRRQNTQNEVHNMKKPLTTNELIAVFREREAEIKAHLKGWRKAQIVLQESLQIIHEVRT